MENKIGRVKSLSSIPCRSSLPHPLSRRVEVERVWISKPNRNIFWTAYDSVLYVIVWTFMNLWFSSSNIYLTAHMVHCTRNLRAAEDKRNILFLVCACISLWLSAIWYKLWKAEAVWRVLRHSREHRLHSTNLHCMSAMSWVWFGSVGDTDMWGTYSSDTKGTLSLVGRVYF